ncbi:MAG: DNA polymerase I [Myxococcales bacterium]|nr:DNA polymerase I [Myxococcales bacterium]
MSRPRIFIIDANNHIFRAFFAIRGMTRADGQATNAIYGFTAMLKRLLHDEKPDYLAMTFDVSRHSFRTDIFPDYKGTRKPAPDDLIPQFPIIRDVVRGFDIPVLELAGWEADDLMATLAVQAEADGMDVTLVSTDKDLCQLVSEHVTLLDPMKDKRLGRAEVMEKMGVPPEQVTQLQGLCGDTSDNIPGVKGVGMKTAAKLIGAYGTIEGVYEAIDAGDKAIKGKRLENLVNDREKAFLSRTLATLSREVPVAEHFGVGSGPGWEKLKVGEPNIEALRTLFEENNLRRFLAELPAKPGAEAETALAPDEPTGPKPLTREGDICVLSWRQLAEMAIELAQGFAFDTETTGLDPLTDQLVGMSFAVTTDRSWYVPLRHRTDDAQAGDQLMLGADTGPQLDPRQLPVDEVLRALTPLFADPDVPKAAQNGKFDVRVLGAAGIPVRGVTFDTMLGSYLLDAHRRGHGLDSLADRWLHHETLHFADLTDAQGKKGTKKKPICFDRVPLDQATAYACEDAQVVVALQQQMAPALADSGLQPLHDDLELPLARVLGDMENIGICVDSAKLRALSAELGQRAGAHELTAFELVGRKFNLGSPKQLQEILFTDLGLPAKKRTKTGFSTDSSVLEQLTDLHELPSLILAWRQATKLKSTYTDVLPTLVNPKTGRIHTSFNQAVAATGRLSSTDPNLQNIPIRTPDGARIRDCFVPAPGHVLLAADYSQIELRILAHLCGDPAMKQAFADGADVHARTASLLFDVEEEKVERQQRAMAKTVNFGILYGMSASRLGREQGISSKEAKAFIERYFARFPDIERWKAEALEQARSDGYTQTLLGRIRKLPELRSKSRMARAAAERVSVNTPIQGSAADVIKVAMVQVHARLAAELPRTRMLLQVHDELVFEVPEDELAAAMELTKGIMEHAFELSVPLVVNAESGQTWLQAH